METDSPPMNEDDDGMVELEKAHDLYHGSQ